MTGRYTTIGQVRQTVTDYYRKHGCHCPFRIILEKIENSLLLEERPETVFDRSMTLLPTDQFAELIDQMPVDMSQILSNPSSRYIYEMFCIPHGRDVAGYSNLPYINDQMHVHDYFEVNYIFRGRARQFISGEERRLEEGELCIFAPHMKHNILVDDEETLVIGLMVRKSTFETIFGNLLTENDLLASFFRNTLYQGTQSHYLLFRADREDQWIRKLIQDIMIEAHSAKRYANAYVNCLVHQLFYILLREYGDTILYYGEGKRTAAQGGFTAILAYVQEHYNTATLNSVAKHFNYSESYLSRLFRQNMHTSLSKVLQNIKMQKAEEFLSGTDIGVAEISRTVGYGSVDYFTKMFKKRYGCTPSDYRKMLAERQPDV